MTIVIRYRWNNHHFSIDHTETSFFHQRIEILLLIEMTERSSWVSGFFFNDWREISLITIGFDESSAKMKELWKKFSFKKTTNDWKIDRERECSKTALYCIVKLWSVTRISLGWRSHKHLSMLFRWNKEHKTVTFFDNSSSSSSSSLFIHCL